ncbi:phosphomevalonate kinase [Lactobacillus iners]|uniref:phosphomevalonate kinase n=1 Tax=Lactobacillus iners TaxID=147802 RepID=UPI001F096665|nr:phosphomevalonate kinase [Lactobacillus iners]MCT7669310.1 phosphomevalonate kinase [Lactobacillus iners]MCT7735315.1 phosphomevalonate kinase [Lactobacillus iners]MCT7777795.1 phosphomevalonate kinase [Lactobacillus iners]MCT7779730.1 phosphomevalonate kinase [Lactobacillus iners]MCT7803612.1 phosphomevalonate kinase [Lactobacillus iners]
MITEKAPGKLYIAGEYAVLEQHCPAILVALNEFVTVSINKSQGSTGVIHSKQYSQNCIYWSRRGNKMIINNRDNPFEYILSAIKFTEMYCLEKGITLAIYDLHINSELDSPDGKKFGLGSSAAVTVATVKAILHFYGIELDKSLIFKLSAIAHYTVQGNGSAGDIAASVYGGWLAYQTFDKQWLKDELKNNKLSKIVKEQWPGLDIKLLTPPKELKLLIGWSKQPASTAQLVDQTNAKKKFIKEKYNQFLNDSRICVSEMIAAFNAGDIKTIQEHIRENRKILANFARMNNISIEIPKLTTLIEIAEKYNGAAKTSGAGNGDCGIVIADSSTNISKLKEMWILNDIKPLDFLIHSIK